MCAQNHLRDLLPCAHLQCAIPDKGITEQGVAGINSINKNMKAGEDPDFFPKYPRVTLCQETSYKTGKSLLATKDSKKLRMVPP
ncbi:hypothetical protein TNIN_332901 [Trichonephila inaurata madagascariensis]|uniref:Uncharacterized protein n=1 Tax=Trichonephila inaurata madagascariensis TaxID=2747483 RepID=A0A8X6ILS9_9ARAC|nr:hypothetical protein TNIN_332901 [Trichonephila inaurata madagascariensis]